MSAAAASSSSANPPSDDEVEVSETIRRYREERAKRVYKVKYLVTGPTSGIGLEIVKHLEATEADFDVVVRDRAAWNAVAAESISPARHHRAYVADLSNIDAIHSVANEIADSGHFYDFIICCAAVRNPVNVVANKTDWLPAKLDDTFIVNVLSHYVILKRLLAKTRGLRKPHVVTLTTQRTRKYGGPFPPAPLPTADADWDTFYAFANIPPSSSGDSQYKRSKAGCVLLAQLIAGGDKMTAISVDPGKCSTGPIANDRFGFLRWLSLTIPRYYGYSSTMADCAMRVMAATTYTDADATRDSWIRPGTWNWPFEWMNRMGAVVMLAILPTDFHRSTPNVPNPILDSFQTFLDRHTP